MKSFYKNLNFLILLFSLFLLSLPGIAQSSVTSARILDGRSNILEVTFNQPIRLSNADGFRLVGGAARIERLASGSGSNKLLFSLSDHVLPDDNFTLLHWQELSDAQSSSERLGSFENIRVDNQASSYHGQGILYYVSSSGNDVLSGTSEKAALRTVEKALSKVKPSDYILLKRGDTWGVFKVVNKNGQKGKPITISSYGEGKKPIIRVLKNNGLEIQNSNYIILDNIHVIMHDERNGITIGGNSLDPTVSNCRIETNGRMGLHGIELGDGGKLVNPIIVNNLVKNFRTNIRSSGYPYDGKFHVYSGLIENNEIAGNHKSGEAHDGITASRGNFHGLIIRKNHIYDWVDDALDFFAADNIIAEYNEIHDPLKIGSTGADTGLGNGIKAGGITSREKINGKKSQNIIIRYNKIYNLQNSKNSRAQLNGITTNNGGSGEIYGNLIFNIGGAGIAVFGSPDSWTIHNNTVYNSERGFNMFSQKGRPNNVIVENNIFKSSKRTMNINTNGAGNIKGGNNILIGKGAYGHYNGKDISASVNEVFENTENFKLKSNSPAVNSGTNFSDYKKDFRGNAINDKLDIGALESGSDAPAKSNPSKNEPEPEPVNTTGEQGLNYKYYEGSWRVLPDFSQLNAVKEGTVDQISLDKRRKNELFAFVFTAYIKIEKGGEYTFYTRSDDGSQLFINDRMIVNNDGLHGPRERSGKINLSEGMHPIRITYFERSGGERLQVSYKGPNLSKRNIPSNVLFLRESEGNDRKDTKSESQAESSTGAEISQNDQMVAGLDYSYYEGSWRALPNFSQQKAVKKGVVRNFKLDNKRRDDLYAFVFEGYIKIEQGGEYTFSTRSDDGSQLFIADRKIVDNDGIHGPRLRSGKIKLEAGYHPILVSFFERKLGETLEVSYVGPGIKQQFIPDNVLYRSSSTSARLNNLNKNKISSEVNKLLEEGLEHQFPSKISVFPNPFVDQINVSLPYTLQKAILRVYNAHGQTLIEKDVSGLQMLNENFSHLPVGVYILQLIDNNNIISTTNLIKK